MFFVLLIRFSPESYAIFGSVIILSICECEMLSQYSRQNVSLVRFVCVMAWGWIVIDMILGAVIGDGL